MANHFGDWFWAYDTVLAETCYCYEPESKEEYEVEAAAYAAAEGDDLTLRGMLSPGTWETTTPSHHWDHISRAVIFADDYDDIPF